MELTAHSASPGKHRRALLLQRQRQRDLPSLIYTNGTQWRLKFGLGGGGLDRSRQSHRQHSEVRLADTIRQCRFPMLPRTLLLPLWRSGH